MAKRHGNGRLLGLGTILVLGLVQAFCVFPPSEWRGHLPILTDDYAHRFYFAQVRLSFLKEHGALWGYDPSHMAGYPQSPLFPPQNDLYEFVLAALPFGRPDLVYKGTVFSLPVLVPLLVWLAAMYAGQSGGSALLAASLSLPVFWAGLPAAMYVSGGLCFVAACFFVPWILAALARYVAAPSTRSWTVLAVLLAGGVFLHPGAAIVAAIPAGFLLFKRAATLGACTWFGVLALGASTVLANWVWIAPCLRLRASFVGFGGGTAGVFDAGYPLLWLAGRRGFPLVAMLAAALAGLAGRAERACSGGRALARDVLVGSTLGAVGLGALSLAGYGTRFLVPVEPYRFLVGVASLLIVPAAAGLRMLLGKRPQAILAAAVGLGALGFTPFLAPQARQGLSLKASLPEEGDMLVEWIRSETRPEGRLLIEDSGWEFPDLGWQVNILRPGHRWFGCHLPALLPLLTGREILGGPFPGEFLMYQFSGFWGGRLFGKNIGTYSDGELADYLRLYNVHWGIVWSGAAKERFDRASEILDQTGEIGAFATYRVRTPGSFFLRGAGRVEAHPGGLRLREVLPAADGSIVLSYHWWDGLTASPSVPLEPEPRLRDPVPFIRISNPPRSLEIATDYERPTF